MLAHLSDPHLRLPGPVPMRAVLNKRLLSLLSWRLNRHRRHRTETLARVIADLHDHAPELTMVTGDLTNLGLDSEFRKARTWLEQLGDPLRVMVIPGNHDAPCCRCVGKAVPRIGKPIGKAIRRQMART